jgi:hypothetical protein
MKQIVTQHVKKFQAFLINWRFFPVHKIGPPPRYTLPWHSWIQPLYVYPVIYSKIIFPSTSRSPKWPYISVDSIRVYESPTNLELVDLISLTVCGEDRKLWSFSLCNFLRNFYHICMPSWKLCSRRLPNMISLRGKYAASLCRSIRMQI